MTYGATRISRLTIDCLAAQAAQGRMFDIRNTACSGFRYAALIREELITAVHRDSREPTFRVVAVTGLTDYWKGSAQDFQSALDMPFVLVTEVGGESGCTV